MVIDTRTTKEWIGKSPDSPVPPRVKLRVFLRHNGTCYLTGRIIRPGELWDAEHIKAMVNGGENRESNLAPALRDKHRDKTRMDLAEKSKTYKKRKKHYGIKKKRSFKRWKLFDGSVKVVE